MILDSGCTKGDHRSCSNYAGWESSYCHHRWMQDNCKQMCGLCVYEGEFASFTAAGRIYREISKSKKSSVPRWRIIEENHTGYKLSSNFLMAYILCCRLSSYLIKYDDDKSCMLPPFRVQWPKARNWLGLLRLLSQDLERFISGLQRYFLFINRFVVNCGKWK